MENRRQEFIALENNCIGVVLTQGYVAIIDAADFSQVSGHLWHTTQHDNKVYGATNLGGGKLKLHRAIMRPRYDVDLDHRDGDGLNCRRSNLREATLIQNAANTRRPHGQTSVYRGVRKIERFGKFRNSVRFAARCGGSFLGTFKDEIEAARAYDAYALEQYGQFAILNFPEERHHAPA